MDDLPWPRQQRAADPRDHPRFDRWPTPDDLPLPSLFPMPPITMPVAPSPPVSGAFYPQARQQQQQQRHYTEDSDFSDGDGDGYSNCSSCSECERLREAAAAPVRRPARRAAPPPPLPQPPRRVSVVRQPVKHPQPPYRQEHQQEEETRTREHTLSPPHRALLPAVPEPPTAHEQSDGPRPVSTEASRMLATIDELYLRLRSGYGDPTPAAVTAAAKPAKTSAPAVAPAAPVAAAGPVTNVSGTASNAAAGPPLSGRSAELQAQLRRLESQWRRLDELSRAGSSSTNTTTTAGSSGLSHGAALPRLEDSAAEGSNGHGNTNSSGGATQGPPSTLHTSVDSALGPSRQPPAFGSDEVLELIRARKAIAGKA